MDEILAATATTVPLTNSKQMDTTAMHNVVKQAWIDRQAATSPMDKRIFSTLSVGWRNKDPNDANNLVPEGKINVGKAVLTNVAWNDQGAFTCADVMFPRENKTAVPLTHSLLDGSVTIYFVTPYMGGSETQSQVGAVAVAGAGTDAPAPRGRAPRPRRPMQSCFPFRNPDVLYDFMKYGDYISAPDDVKAVEDAHMRRFERFSNVKPENKKAHRKHLDTLLGHLFMAVDDDLQFENDNYLAQGESFVNELLFCEYLALTGSVSETEELRKDLEQEMYPEHIRDSITRVKNKGLKNLLKMARKSE